IGFRSSPRTREAPPTSIRTAITRESVYMGWISLLKNGEVVVGDLQNDAGHGRRIVGAHRGVGPEAVVAVAPPRQQLLADGGKPLLPVLAAGGPHRLGGVILAVVVVHVGQFTAAESGAIRPEALQVGETAIDVLAFVDAGAVQGADAGCRPRECRDAL